METLQISADGVIFIQQIIRRHLFDYCEQRKHLFYLNVAFLTEGGVAASSSGSEGHVHLRAPGQNCNSGV